MTRHWWRRLALAVLLLALGVVVSSYLWPRMILRAATAVVERRDGFRVRQVQTNEGVVPYLDGGSGPVVLLLHGFQDSKESWLGFATPLTASHRVLIPDLHGFGDNHAATDGDYRPPAQARRMAEFIRALGVGEVDVAGVSMGGEIAAAFAAASPELTRSVALISSAGTVSDTLTPIGRRLLAGDNIFHVETAADFDTLVMRIADSGMSIPGLFRRAAVQEYRARNPEWDTVFAQLSEPAMRVLTDSLAPDIAAPALVLWGAHDPIFHRSTAARLAGRLPHAELTVFPDCGHLCPASRPAEVSARYLRFLAERGVRGPGARAGG
ncbi:MAG TPA: alpha/beta hydrolase [Gemmatimonadales bacterium]